MTFRRVIATTARHRLFYSAVCIFLVVAARGLLSLALIRHGIRALSDDDYSRVVISQLFAEKPSIDPSHTSWLPFPFWLYGTCMACFGKSLAVAQAVGFAVGLCSAAIIWFAARVLGIPRPASVLSCLIAIAIPYSAWLGLATTPDVYSAALVFLSCATLARGQISLRLLGALALGLASLSRYEAWPVAILWATFNGLDALRARSRKYAWLAIIGLLPPALWMLHGLQTHGNALFFVERVASYQRALGTTDIRRAARLLRIPWRLVADAPEVWALLVFVLLCGGRPRKRQTLVEKPRLRWRKRWTRPVCAMSSAVLLVWVGDWCGSTATHHASRTLLAPWFMLSALTCAALWGYVRLARGWRLARFVLGAIGTGALAMLFVRPAVSSTEPPQDRGEEVRFGLLASVLVPQGALLAIDTTGYGYFAVQAAFARPRAVRIINRHDPRHPIEDPFRSSLEARRTLNALGTDWLVATRGHEQALSAFATSIERGPTLFIAKAH